MRIAVLASPNAWHFRDLQRAAPQHDVFNFRFEELAGGIDGRLLFNLEADCVIVRTMALGSLQQVVFRMDLLAQLERAGVLVLNSPKTIEVAVDKYLSLARLSEASIPVPATWVSQDVESALRHFELLGGDAVVKPIFGSMGNGICRVQTEEMARAHFSELESLGHVIYQQAFVNHDHFDIRLLVIGKQILAMKRVNSSNWITNISQGGRGIPYEPTAHECDLARRSANAVGAVFAGVDLVHDSHTGEVVVLEVNAVPGWSGISEVLGIDVGQMVVSEIEARWSTQQ